MGAQVTRRRQWQGGSGRYDYDYDFDYDQGTPQQNGLNTGDYHNMVYIDMIYTALSPA